MSGLLCALIILIIYFVKSASGHGYMFVNGICLAKIVW